VAAASPRGNIAGKVFSAYNKYGVKYAEKSNAKCKLATFYRIYKVRACSLHPGFKTAGAYQVYENWKI
jgi:hypothetical protein